VRFIYLLKGNQSMKDARFWKIFQAVVPHCYNQQQAEDITQAVIDALARPKKEEKAE